MADFTARVHAALRDALAERRPAYAWETEWYVRRTPVDVSGIPDSPNAPLALVEVEMRRADPANNPVKLARYAHGGGAFDRDALLVQCFSRYYDLESGGVSSKRQNAQFVGTLATDALDGFDYEDITLDLAPPKAGDDPPDGWRDAVMDAADAVASLLD